MTFRFVKVDARFFREGENVRDFKVCLKESKKNKITINQKYY